METKKEMAIRHRKEYELIIGALENMKELMQGMIARDQYINDGHMATWNTLISMKSMHATWVNYDEGKPLED